MPNQELLKKYAKLAVQVGANVQKDQLVLINAPASEALIARMIVEEAFKAGAKDVYVDFADSYCNHSRYKYATTEQMMQFHPHQEEKIKFYMNNDVARIHVIAEVPGLMKDIDSKKLQDVSLFMSSQPVVKENRKRSMANETQWTIVAVSTPDWAAKVFPDLNIDEAIELLWDKIFIASRVDLESDPVENWKNHMDTLARHNKILNDYNFKELHFHNSLGTNLKLGLVEGHIWAGGREKDLKGREFAPNIPTEETFTMPHKYQVEGTVYATTPLNYQGKLIENFHLTFKEGKVVSFKAEKEEGALKNLIEHDEGSGRLGEVALISYDSPISKMKILFFNTLFDENASCHLALGASYPMNIKNGAALSEEERNQVGSNNSQVHSDFMFGSPDMEITGTTHNGEKIAIFKNGNFVF